MQAQYLKQIISSKQNLQKLFSEDSGQISYSKYSTVWLVQTLDVKLQYNEILHTPGHLQNSFIEQPGLLITDQGSYPVYENSRC